MNLVVLITCGLTCLALWTVVVDGAIRKKPGLADLAIPATILSVLFLAALAAKGSH